MRTEWEMQARTVDDMMSGSPEWKPQATFAMSIKGRRSSSGPFGEAYQCTVGGGKASAARNERI